ncbi:MAG: 16S rRNA (cytosine(1402)-N(4))-methyltransferase RsmH [Proteobacteria bacterium]|jgi:16S rRNA (cytosine1402-N4)-methyltransferase|nr:16S rRNA (cytosine(1402)-N(4))-methyltransferase RsmH [Pseudomonadota bacterium]MCG6935299.1 16S rRNA (cytosine(1402)-N(4))-methyltransferase RsmH [Pseudomonadota bacterium]
MAHQPVLLEEALQGLNIKSDGIYVDGTFGRGGHATALLSRLGASGRLLALDKDPQAIAEAERCIGKDERFTLRQSSFADLKETTRTLGWLGQVDGILLDLGVSSPQLDDASRGFSFQQDGPLDMRMNPDAGQSAAEWLAGAREQDIVKVLKEYGEERFARRIARAILKTRSEQPITTTGQLAAIVAAAVPSREPGKDPATRSFQAIRIFINHELDDLQACLTQVLDVLKPGGRLVVISFHSLEDRLVKRFIREQEKGDRFPPDMPVTHIQLNPRLRAVGKPVRPAEAEIRANPRARSAIMRVAERLTGAGE